MKKLPQLLIFIALFLTTITSWAVLPPKYLSVPGWKDCVGQVSKEGAQFICLPATKPANCAADAFKQLNDLNEIDSCPSSD